MKNLIFASFILLLISCKKESLQEQNFFISVKLLADNGRAGKELLDSVMIYTDKSHQDTANQFKEGNDLGIKTKKGILSAYTVKNVFEDSIPLSIKAPTLTNYILRIVTNVPYDIDAGKFLVLYDAVKETPGQPSAPGITGISGGGVFELFFKNDGYDLEKRFAIEYLK